MNDLKKQISPMQILLRFLKVGIIGFGGGSALIPVIEKEFAGERGPMSEQDYLKHTVVANITPGALPVKLGATCGYQLGGTAGALAGAYGAMLPGSFLTVLIMSLFSWMGSRAIQLFSFASVGISAVIVTLLLSYVRKVCGAGNRAENWTICIVSFLLTCGREVRQLLAQLLPESCTALGTPLFDLSTISLMIAALLMIVAYTARPGWVIMLLSGMLCLGFVFFRGCAFADTAAARLCLGAAAMLLIIPLRKGGRTMRRGDNGPGCHVKGSVRTVIGIFLGLAVAAAAVLTALYGREVLSLAWNFALSTLTSFGGGEAYISVADGFFVQTGYVSGDIYYAQLVPVANALPGPILVKVAAGIGYLFGEAGWNGTAAWLLAAMAAVICTNVCCTLAIFVLQMYDAVGRSAFVMNLKRFILPVICGMLLSTALSMLCEASKITAGHGLPAGGSLAAMAVWILLLSFLRRKFSVHDGILLALSSLASLALITAMGGG